MSDSDAGSTAWLVPPTQYLENRPPRFGLPKQPRSVYVTMRDGCRLAVDVYLPQPDAAHPPATLPTVLLFTPYYRRFKLKAGAKGVEPSPNCGKYRDFFVPRGYAVVVVDVRGTGASFGTRDSFRSPKERDDYREIIDWVVAEPWSDGRVGVTGISYLGAASDFAASTGHPAVKAIAPLFAVWDTYSDHYYPGGLLLNQLAETYDRLMIGLDHNRRDYLAEFAYYNDPSLDGPQPVDGDEDCALRDAAVKEHLGNFHMPDFITEFRFKDDALPYDPEFTSASFSPYKYRDGIREDVAVLAVSGWMDGAGYMNGAISRFLTLKNNPRHLLLGPWDHGARINVSPWRAAVEAQFPVLGEVLRFFDHYLMETDTGLDREQPIHFFNMQDEVWRSAPSWPPIEDMETLHLADSALSRDRQGAGSFAFDVDASAGTGEHTRYERLAAIDNREYYSDWAECEAGLPSLDSAPLGADMELSGHGIADLWIASSEPDAALFVYLSEVKPDGEVRYVTEGMLRALHRAEAPCPDHHRTTWPFRNFSRAEALPLTPGEPARMHFALLPTSWTFRRGSRIRLSFAGADIDHFSQAPHGRPPRITVFYGGDRGSKIELPLRACKNEEQRRRPDEALETIDL